MSNEYDLGAILSVAREVCPSLVDFYEGQLQAIESAGAMREAAFTDEFLDTWNGGYLLLRDAVYESLISVTAFGPALQATAEAIQEQEDITVTEMEETGADLQVSNFGTLADQTLDTMTENAAPEGYVDAATRYGDRAEDLEAAATATPYDDLEYVPGDEFRGVEPSDPSYEAEEPNGVREEDYTSGEIRDQYGRQDVDGGSAAV